MKKRQEIDDRIENEKRAAILEVIWIIMFIFDDLEILCFEKFEIETNFFAIYHCRRSLKPQRHSRRRDNGERKRDRVLAMEMTEVLVGVGTSTVQMTNNPPRSVARMMEKSQNLWVEIPVVAIERDIDR